jgi:plasmid stabilization system protein ParE
VRRYRVVFAPEAVDHLDALYAYVAAAASPATALSYADAIVSYCDGLNISPHRGSSHDDVRPGLRVTNYKKRAVIAFTVDENLVSIIGIYYGGQDYESDLS